MAFLLALAYPIFSLTGVETNFFNLIPPALGLLGLCWLLVSKKKPWGLSDFLVLFLVALLVQFRVDNFFYWDTWHLIDRFRLEGFGQIFTTHNEHFLPLGFAFLWAEFKLLGDFYLGYQLVSLFLHTLNSWFLYLVVKGLFFNKNGQYPIETLARVSGLGFSLSALHAEALQWEFEQTLLLSFLFCLLSILGGLRFLKSGSFHQALLAGFFALLAPLCFGNGFIVALLMGLLVLFSLCINQTSFKQGFILLATVAVFMALPVGFYLASLMDGSAGDGKGVSLAYRTKYAAKYLLFGSQLGTVFRGLGLYPGLEFGSANALFGGIAEDSRYTSVNNFSDPENICMWLGCLSSLLLLGLSLLSRSLKKLNFFLIVLGQAWIIAAFLLPAWNRFDHGHGQALSLRYQYMALPGLFLSLAPLILWFSSSKKNSEKTKANLGFLTAFFFIIAQLWQGTQFSYFTAPGRENRTYIEALSRGEIEKVPASLTPGFTPERVLLNYKWLSE